MRRHFPWLTLLVAFSAAAHDDKVGARYVQAGGTNVDACLEHHDACRTIQYALSQTQPGNSVKVGAGIYDMSGVDPASFLFGRNKAEGGFAADGHFDASDPRANPTILVGVDPRYMQALAKQGFMWAADRTFAEAGWYVDGSGLTALQSTQLAANACTQGFAGQFPCQNVDFLAQLPLSSFSTRPSSAANLWGFVDLNDNREYALVGLRNGTAIIDVTDPASPREVTTIAGAQSPWREVKVYQVRDTAANRYRAYAYVSTEAGGAGLQVIDLSGLPNSATLATTLRDTGSQHTLYVSNVDYGTNVALPGAEAFLYVAGANVNAGAWRIYSLANPAAPQLVAPAPAGTQYMHDSTSLLITDSRVSQCEPGHTPCQVLVDFNENTVDLWDVTDKNLPARLSSTTYPNVAFTHSGWPTADQQFLVFHDELEEINFGLNTQIYTLNLANLRAPTAAISFRGPTTATDHNGYTRGNLYYVSHYRRGLVVFDVSDPLHLREVASFDTFLQPAANTAGTDGAWGVYPFLPSGNVLVSDISNGLFVLKANVSTTAPGRLTFVGNTAAVAEGGGNVTVRVQRTGGSSGAVSVQYATADSAATAGSDYATANGTLSWTDGDATEKSFTVAITNDTQVESDETFTVALSNPVGTSVEGTSTLTVTITNDDSSTPSTPTTPTTPPSSSGGGGGSGLGGLEWLLALTAALRLRRVRGFIYTGTGR